MNGWQQAILDFWFGLDPQRHWRPDPVLDTEIKQRFGALLDRERAASQSASGEPGGYLQSADHALAAIILFDQFPRNIYRDDRRAFATDPLARRIAAAVVDRGLDAQVPVDRRLFFYLPFEHSENLADQELCVRLVAALGNPDWTDFARKHRDLIARFGRFPHRNAVLGRASTDEEKAFGLAPAW